MGGVLVGGIAITAIGLIGLKTIVFGSAAITAGVVISPLLVAMALAIGLHILILEATLNSDIHWENIKGQTGFIIGAVLAAIGLVVEGVTPLGAILGVLATMFWLGTI